MSPLILVKDKINSWWTKYFALVDVAEENTRLREKIRTLEQTVILNKEDREELARLRRLLQIEPLQKYSGFAARVIAMRFGPQSALNTITINKGYLHGAVVGTPVLAPSGVVGKVYRAAPHASTVLLLNDPGFRLAVISQNSRTPGIIRGMGDNSKLLEMTYVAQNANISEGELLITAGLDGDFPKGIPIGLVTKVQPGHETLFLQVQAEPMVQFSRLEEVVLLPPGDPGAKPAGEDNAEKNTNNTDPFKDLLSTP